MTAPLFYADHLPQAGSVLVTGDDARHAAGAMRLHPGEPVLVSDGAGRISEGTVVRASRAQVEIAVTRSEVLQPPREVRVVQAIPKGERGDLAVELLTETGASVIVPWAAARNVADWRGKEAAKRQRWRRVAQAAAMQSRRAFLPEIAPMATGVPEIVGQGLVLHEEAERSLFDLHLPPGPLTVVVGPEGGLTDAEVEAMAATGALVVGLGREIMRTSTAGAAACVWIRGFEMRGGT